MSWPDRRSDRSLSRRSPEQQQQTSPFRRALYEDFDIPRANSPSNRNGPRHRRYTSQTGTLRGAFEATRVPTVEEAEEFAYAPGSPSPRGNKMMNYSVSPQSNPPDEIVEAYRKIRGDQDLNPGDWVDSGARGYDEDELHDPFVNGDEASFLDDVIDESPRRRKHADHVNDEKRLRQATNSYSPVFSRARTGTNSGLTAEDLQRREVEDEDGQEQHEEEGMEDDRGLEPSLNLPSTWGSRATNRRDWMKNISRRSESGSRKEVNEPTGDSALWSKPRLESSTNPARTSFERSPRRTSLETRNTGRERPTYTRTTSNDEHPRPDPEQKDQKSTEREQIPNTPISIYKNSTFNKRSPAKRDSQDLLRRLSRAESPKVNASENQMKTPEPTKSFERRIYEKTPVVTGAWIDTPMTEKVTELPEDLTRDIIPTPAERKEPENPPQPQLIGSRIDTRPSWEKHQEPAGEKLAEKGREQERKEKAEEMKEPEKTEPPVTMPDLPKSGLETYIRELQANKDSEALGEDTIESLEMLMEDPKEINQQNGQNGQPTEVKTEAEQDAAYEKAVLKKLEGTPPPSGTTPDGTVNFDQFNQKLESLVRNLHELKTGFQGFEDRINQDTAFISRATSSKNKENKRQQQHIHADEDCSTCVARNNGRLYASIPLPYLWRRDPTTHRIRPTRLAWCISISVLWLFSESTMCDYYCHPTYATVCEGNCLRPDAPEFPYVIPTMLWRWTHLSSFLAPVVTVLLACCKFAAQLLGLWDGFVDDGGPPGGLDLAGEVRIRGTRIAGAPAVATPGPDTQKPSWYGQPQSVPGLGVGSGQGAMPPPVQWGDEQSLDDDELL